MVGEYFLENPNNYEEINHKDFNRSNNKVENLEWISHEDNIKYSVSNDRFKSKKKIKIKQYDLNGNLIKIWDSILDIKKELNLESISACCKGRRNTIGNFVWRYENDDFNKYRTKKYKGRKVGQYTKDGKLINTFESIAEAERFNGWEHSKCNISRCCNGLMKSSNGYVWKYLDL